jgi:polysaccharide export outer membrane protein
MPELRNFLTCLLILLGAQAAWAKEAQDRAPAAAADQQADYLLGAGDVLRITVFQSPELSLEARVSESGTLSYPLLGTLNVRGLTAAQAEARIADGLRNGNFMRQPHVNVFVTQVRAHQVSVLGQVNRPGRYPLDQSDMRLSQVLALAGGVTSQGSDLVTLSGLRNGKRFSTSVNAVEFSQVDGDSADLPVRNGDTVFVERAHVIYIYGEVQRPGQVRLEPDMTLMQALAAGGGTTQRGTERGIQIRRRNAQGKVQILRPSMDEPLRVGDVVYVRESVF